MLQNNCVNSFNYISLKIIYIMFYLGTFLIINKCNTNIFIQFVIACIGYIIIFSIFQKNFPKEYFGKYFYFWIFLIVTDICIWVYLRFKCHKIEESNCRDLNINDEDDIFSDSEDYTITHSSVSESDYISDTISDKSDTIFI
ncbi:hypothetical protein H012_gp396 [Acanthamoeba polyphaga moumouvirus]|uniref:Uncharacterized protein n=2 Tax=Moumouvirus TaxID=3080801 RepID=L7RDA7_9VIRU|nr:hypothetical protein H012_gp396 [Acanthamoeba polyphaga moumouvirus]AEX62646.1 hypothetical protein mv_R441 [Moumouvirus Monve]AGC02063.1 hypothetical protein Moumou_00529 [Acanthamoeba polyphaga moumouvirus]AQN68429.1 hypothetical protein [Saudi moumouvirus]